VVKEFWRKTASPSRHPSRREWIRPTFTSSRAHTSQPLKRHLDRLSRFCVHRCSLPVIFNKAGRITPQLPILSGDLHPRRIHSSLGPSGSAFQTASRSVQPFLHGSWTWPTDRPRYLVSSNRPLSLANAAMRPNNNRRFLKSDVKNWALVPGVARCNTYSECRVPTCWTTSRECRAPGGWWPSTVRRFGCRFRSTSGRWKRWRPSRHRPGPMPSASWRCPVSAPSPRCITPTEKRALSRAHTSATPASCRSANPNRNSDRPIFNQLFRDP